MKVIELIKVNKIYFGNFSSCLEKSKVILEFLSCPNSKWNFPQIGIWISNCFAQIHPLPLKISSGSLNKFCRVHNSEGLLFWPKFDFYSKLWSNLKKIRKGEIVMATVPEEGGCTAGRGRMHCRRGRHRCFARRHAPRHTAARLLEVAVKWPNSWRPHPLLPVTIPRCTLLLFSLHSTLVSSFASKIRRAHSPSEPPEHLCTFAKVSATVCTPWCKL